MANSRLAAILTTGQNNHSCARWLVSCLATRIPIGLPHSLASSLRHSSAQTGASTNQRLLGTDWPHNRPVLGGTQRRRVSCLKFKLTLMNHMCCNMS
jgi:hypothetical protein